MEYVKPSCGGAYFESRSAGPSLNGAIYEDIKLGLAREMSDNEIILRSLEKVEWRVRANRRFQDVSQGLVVFLLVPLVFKIFDLVYPFRARVVFPVLGTWFLVLIGYSIWLLGRKGTLSETASLVDKRLTLQDELTTACWFIHNPRPSEWIDQQIRRAAASVRKIDPAALYPAVIPKSAFVAAGILLLLIFINFSPISGNRNWFALQAAPAYALSNTERDLFEAAENLLSGTVEGEKLQTVMQRLQAGEISASEAIQQLGDIQAALETNRLDLDGITAELADIGNNLQRSQLFQGTAATLAAMKLPEAAEEMIASSKILETISAAHLSEAQESLERASRTSSPELNKLAADFKEATSSLVQNSLQSAKVGLSKAAQELQLLGSLVHNQQAKDLASQQLENLMNTMQQRAAAEGGLGSGNREGIGRNNAPPEGPQSSDMPAGNEAFGAQPSGGSGQDAPRLGPPTSLRVQLQREQVHGQRDEQLKETEPSRREKPNAEYTNIESAFRPIPKDLMNRDRIPRNYRPLIRDYFLGLESSR
jgi:hypothetical protein